MTTQAETEVGDVQGRGKRSFYTIVTVNNSLDFDIINHPIHESIYPKTYANMLFRNGVEIIEQPVVQINNGRSLDSLVDFGLLDSTWLISQKMKDLLGKLDPGGFEAIRCNTVLKKGAPGPDYWFINVTRIIDAVDPENSTYKIMHFDDRNWGYSFLGGKIRYRRQDATDNIRMFRVKYYESEIILDDVFKDACKKAQIKGVRFINSENN